MQAIFNLTPNVDEKTMPHWKSVGSLNLTNILLNHQDIKIHSSMKIVYNDTRAYNFIKGYPYFGQVDEKGLAHGLGRVV